MKIIYDDIQAERNRQDQKWGAVHDSDHTPSEWYEILDTYSKKAAIDAQDRDFGDARRRYIQVAALAVAAVEALDRKRE